jgi:hypothetical protein
VRLLRLGTVIGAVSVGAMLDRAGRRHGLGIRGRFHGLSEGMPAVAETALGRPTDTALRAVHTAHRVAVAGNVEDVGRYLVAGAAGGLAGGMTMTVAMTAGRKTGKVKAPVPLKVERWGRRRLGLSAPSDQREHAVAQAIHLGYSLSLGVGYGLLQHARDLRAIPAGPLYGAVVYALNLAGALPALGIVPPPWKTSRAKVARQLMMHVVFGTVTALVSGRVREKLGR